ncbi:hypothetical protein E2C01_094730 [Portunus trituberculatus]|uniref:Uncharacterized protein n=1 Tax=Portunus trituberculatus TaxID=210409 RepID=A0A5B7JY01_PORTR|nr:hypothetical protein [Portunus trituberculatus]
MNRKTRHGTQWVNRTTTSTSATITSTTTTNNNNDNNDNGQKIPWLFFIPHTGESEAAVRERQTFNTL